MYSSEVLAQAVSMTDVLKANARSTDEQGLTLEGVEALKAAGLLKPTDPLSISENGRALGAGCGATAYLATALAVGASLVAKADPADEALLAEHRLLWVGELSEPVFDTSAEGLVLSGRLPQVGGLECADSLIITGLTHGDQAVIALVPRSAVSGKAYDYRGGLRGLRWQDVSLERAPVRLLPLSAEIQAAYGEDVVLLGALMGVAQGGYDDYVSTTRARITGIGGQAVAQFTQVQARLAESHAELKAITALYDTVSAKVAAGEAHHPEVKRDRVFIAHKSQEALNRLLSQMGAMGLSESNPVQRRYRDLRALACTRGLNWVEQMPAFGRFELGLDQ